MWWDDREQRGGREESERETNPRGIEATLGLSPKRGCTQVSAKVVWNLGRPSNHGEGPVAFRNHGAIRPGLAPLRQSNY